MPNPNEMERVRQEGLLSRRAEIMNDLRKYIVKSEKEGLLRELRRIEDDLGIVGLPYNGGIR